MVCVSDCKWSPLSWAALLSVRVWDPFSTLQKSLLLRSSVLYFQYCIVCSWLCIVCDVCFIPYLYGLNGVVVLNSSLYRVCDFSSSFCKMYFLYHVACVMLSFCTIHFCMTCVIFRFLSNVFSLLCRVCDVVSDPFNRESVGPVTESIHISSHWGNTHRATKFYLYNFFHTIFVPGKDKLYISQYRVTGGTQTATKCLQTFVSGSMKWDQLHVSQYLRYIASLQSLQRGNTLE